MRMEPAFASVPVARRTPAPDFVSVALLAMLRFVVLRVVLVPMLTVPSAESPTRLRFTKSLLLAVAWLFKVSFAAVGAGPFRFKGVGWGGAPAFRSPPPPTLKFAAEKPPRMPAGGVVTPDKRLYARGFG